MDGTVVLKVKGRICRFLQRKRKDIGASKIAEGFVSQGPSNFGEVTKVAECFVKIDFGFGFVYFVGVLSETIGAGTMPIIQINTVGFSSQLSPLGRQTGTKIMNK